MGLICFKLVKVSIEGQINQTDGFVIDFYDIDSIFNKYIHPLIDHKVLNEVDIVLKELLMLSFKLLSSWELSLGSSLFLCLAINRYIITPINAKIMYNNESCISSEILK